MKTRILGVIAVGLMAGPMSASAVTWYATGKFGDGGTLSGSFVQTSDECSSESLPGAKLSTSAGAVLWANDYSIEPPESTDMCAPDGGFSRLIFTDKADSYLDLYLASPLLVGTKEVSIESGEEGFVDLFDDVTRFLISGSLSTTPPGGVPEPGTLALFGLGLAGLGLSRRRKTT